MTETGFSQRSVAALAALVHEVRPSWNEAGIAAEVRRHSQLPLAAVALAVLNAACDPRNETPAVLSQDNNRAWMLPGWRCKKHPEQRACRVNGECASCYADRQAAEYAPRPARDTSADPHPLESALARLGAVDAT